MLSELIQDNLIVRRAPCSTSFCSLWASPFSPPPSATPSIANGCEAPMSLDYTLAGLVTIGLTIYLTYALLRPEKF